MQFTGGASKMKYLCIQKMMTTKFKLLGRTIAKYHLHFLVIPILLSAILSLGLLRLSYVRDLEYLFSPLNGRAMTDKNTIDKIFPMNTSENFDYLRVINKIRFSVVIVISKDGSNMLRKNNFKSVLLLDEIIRNVTVTWNGQVWDYTKICAKSYGQCSKMDVINLKGRIDGIISGKEKIRFPMDTDSTHNIVYPVNLGGVSVDADDNVEDVRAIRLFYFLDNEDEMKDNLALMWEEEFLKTVGEVQFDDVEVTRLASSCLDNVTSKNIELLLPVSPVSVILIVFFSVVTCMTRDCVRSKPWLGLCACLSAGLAIASTFGLVMLCGVQYADINISVPFLVLGIGVDDSFVLLAAWRKTNPKDSVKKRMGESYSEAAASITITSLTNFLSFSMGIMTPFPIVRIFCLYAAISMLVAYFYQITFFGSCMVLSGLREEQRLHPFTFKEIKKSQMETGERFLQHNNNNNNNNNNYELIPIEEGHSVMYFFRDTVGGFLITRAGKATVLISLLAYLGLSIWGCILLKVGLDYRKLFPYGSYEADIMTYDFKYFTQYPDRIHIAITSPVDYSDPNMQMKIDNMIQRFENNSHITRPEFTESWLKYFLNFTNHHPQSWLFLHGFNMSEKQDFIAGLKIFLKIPWARRFNRDIVFSTDGTEIISSRFFVQSKDVTYGELQKQLILDSRHIVDTSDLPVVVHSLWFPVYEHLSMIKKVALKSIGIAAISVTIITLLFIPDISCAISVTFAIASIQIGIIGFMSLWSVNLDMISVIALVMCVGFSVDYASHICYAYIASNSKTPDGRIKDSLYAVGMPITQGSVSTILGLTSLAFSQSYSFTVVFKLVFLVILFAVLFAICVLPVLLSLLDVIFRKNFRETSVPLQKQTIPIDLVNGERTEV